LAELTSVPPNYQKDLKKEQLMSSVRVLVGTKKGGFVITSDGKRQKWK